MVDRLTSIIVPAWRGGSRPPVAGLVESVAASMTAPWELIVVCNGSDPALLEYIRGPRPITRIAFLSQNAGVARAWNIGAQLALGEFLVFANEDLVLGLQSAQKLVDALAEDHSIGVVGPRGTRWDITPTAARHVEHVSGQGLVDCDVVSGFLFAMRRDVLRFVGYFDDELAPCSYEEVDIGLAVRRAGFRLCALGGLQYVHEWGVSAWNPNRRIEWMGGDESIEDINLRNHAHVLRKWHHAEPVRLGGRDRANSTSSSPTIERLAEPIQNGSHGWPSISMMIDAVESTKLISPGARVLHVGSSAALVATELVRRGYEAYALDPAATATPRDADPQHNRAGIIMQTVIDRSYDLIIAMDTYSDLNDPESRILTRRFAAICSTLVVAVPNSTETYSSSRNTSYASWVRLFADCGYRLARSATSRARSLYESGSAGAQRANTAVLVLRRHTPSRASSAVSKFFVGVLMLPRVGRTLKNILSRGHKI